MLPQLDTISRLNPRCFASPYPFLEWLHFLSMHYIVFSCKVYFIPACLTSRTEIIGVLVTTVVY